MSEQQLRDLLRQVVPEGHDLDATTIRRRADRQRAGRAAAIGSAAAVVSIAAGVLAIAGLDPGSAPRPGGVATPGTGKATRAWSPYDVPPCPSRPREGNAGGAAVDDLEHVVAVRLCPDFDPRRPGTQPPLSPDERAEVQDADALVHDLAGFVRAVRALPTGLPEYCSTDQGPWSGESFVFHRADGSRTELPTAGCELTTIEGRAVHGGALRELYLEALDRQRGSVDYTRPFDEELTCVTGPRAGPIRPGRERLVAAVLCTLPPGAESVPEDLEPVPLDERQLAELDRAWARPGDPIVRGPSGHHECVDGLPEPPPFIMAATDRSDVVQLLSSPCEVLVWHGWDGHAGATLPTTLAALGLE